MKWIDLVSKLVAPIFISIVAMWLKSDVELSLAIAAMNLTLLLPEWYCAQQAWRSSIELQEPKQTFLAGQPEVVPGMISGLQLYFRYDVWRSKLSIYDLIFATNPTKPRIASLAMALQSYSVLSLSASMTTYLLSIHYTLAPITLARTISSVIELTSVVVMPVGVSLLRKLNGNPVFGLAWVGLAGITWQVLTLVPAVASLFLLPVTSSDPASSSALLTMLFFGFLSMSGLGFWTFNLVAQSLVQMLVPSTERVEFSGVEYAFMSGAEIGRWGITAVLPHPTQFPGVAMSGLVIIVISALLFTSWMWKQWSSIHSRNGIFPVLCAENDESLIDGVIFDN